MFYVEVIETTFEGAREENHTRYHSALHEASQVRTMLYPFSGEWLPVTAITQFEDEDTYVVFLEDTQSNATISLTVKSTDKVKILYGYTSDEPYSQEIDKS